MARHGLQTHGRDQEMFGSFAGRQVGDGMPVSPHSRGKRASANDGIPAPSLSNRTSATGRLRYDLRKRQRAAPGQLRPFANDRSRAG